MSTFTVAPVFSSNCGASLAITAANWSFCDAIVSVVPASGLSAAPAVATAVASASAATPNLNADVLIIPVTLFRCDKGAETEYTSNKIALKKRQLSPILTEMHILAEHVTNKGSKNTHSSAATIMLQPEYRPCSIHRRASVAARRIACADRHLSVRSRPRRRSGVSPLHNFASSPACDQRTGRLRLYAAAAIGNHSFQSSPMGVRLRRFDA